MHITVVTPAAAGSRSGNRATANRWAGFLRQLGHKVRILTEYRGQPTDLMLALHAWRSAPAVQRFRESFPGKPLIVALTGTDIYHFQYTEPEVTQACMAQADTLIALHPGVAQQITPALSSRMQVVYQSAQAPAARQAPLQGRFEVCVIGHLRHEKDPLRAALAVRDLPESSRLQVVALGKAHDASWSTAAREEMDSNPRYHWRGEVPPARVREMMARARLMVISSRMEGGANVVSEACVAGLPVIASDIDGNRGLLGEDYPGYYPVEDTDALRTLLLQAEQDPDWLLRMALHCRGRSALFTPQAEKASLARALEKATGYAQSR